MPDVTKADRIAEAQKRREALEAGRRSVSTGQFGDGRPATGTPTNERVVIDQVFGIDAKIVDGVPIEQGSGALPVM